MPLTDWPLERLREYRPQVAEPADFDAFWTRTLAESRSVAGETVLRPARTPVTGFHVDDLAFSGFDGERIAAWLIRPAHIDRALPTVVEYRGYGSGRGLPHEHLRWAATGCVHVVMDTRGQGSGAGSGGETPDPHGSGPATSGSMTRGIDAPDGYYYRRVFTDAALLVDAVRALEAVDAERVAVSGASQGGGIALAVAGLTPGLAAVLPDVPFLSDMRRSVESTPRGPFMDVRTYLSVHRDRVEETFTTLAYFDAVNFARRATAPARFSVGLMDDIVPPSAVYAAFNHYAQPDKTIDEYAFNGHEGGGDHQWVRQADWIRERWGL